MTSLEQQLCYKYGDLGEGRRLGQARFTRSTLNLKLSSMLKIKDKTSQQYDKPKEQDNIE